MNLLIKTINNQIVLCDDNGEPLPGQRAAVLDTEHNDFPRLTVTFFVNGKGITLMDTDTADGGRVKSSQG